MATNEFRMANAAIPLVVLRTYGGEFIYPSQGTRTMGVLKTNITRSRSGHYTVTVRENGKLLFKEGQLNSLGKAQSVAQTWVRNERASRQQKTDPETRVRIQLEQATQSDPAQAAQLAHDLVTLGWTFRVEKVSTGWHFTVD